LSQHPGGTRLNKCQPVILMCAFEESPQRPINRQVFIGPNMIKRSDLKKRGGRKHDKYQGNKVSKKVGKTE